MACLDLHVAGLAAEGSKPGISGSCNGPRRWNSANMRACTGDLTLTSMQVAALAAEGDALDVSGGYKPDPELGERLKGVVAAGKAWEAAADAMLHARKVSVPSRSCSSAGGCLQARYLLTKPARASAGPKPLLRHR